VVRSIKKAEVEDWRLEVSAGYRHDVFRTFRQVFTWSIARGLVEADPTGQHQEPEAEAP
jgi:hypothetical protein